MLDQNEKLSGKNSVRAILEILRNNLLLGGSYDDTELAGRLQEIENRLGNYATMDAVINQINSVIKDVSGLELYKPSDGVLPDAGEKGKIYLIPTEREEPDIYDEYYWDSEREKWEKLGNTRLDANQGKPLSFGFKHDFSSYVPFGLLKIVPPEEKTAGNYSARVHIYLSEYQVGTTANPVSNYIASFDIVVCGHITDTSSSMGYQGMTVNAYIDNWYDQYGSPGLSKPIKDRWQMYSKTKYSTGSSHALLEEFAIIGLSSDYVGGGSYGNKYAIRGTATVVEDNYGIVDIYDGNELQSNIDSSTGKFKDDSVTVTSIPYSILNNPVKLSSTSGNALSNTSSGLYSAPYNDTSLKTRIGAVESKLDGMDFDKYHKIVSVSAIGVSGGTAQTERWRKFAETTITTSHADVLISFKVIDTFYYNSTSNVNSDNVLGAFTAHVHTTASPFTDKSVFAQFQWEYVTESTNLKDFVLCWEVTGEGSEVAVSLWFNMGYIQNSLMLVDMLEVNGWKTVDFSTWTLYNVTAGTGETTLPETVHQVVSTLAVSKNNSNSSAGDYMTKTDPAGTGTFSMNRKSDSAIGQNSVAIGYKSVASGEDAIAIGNNANAAGYNSVAIGPNASCSYTSTNSIAMGLYSAVSGLYAIAMGYHCQADGLGLAIGKYNDGANIGEPSSYSSKDTAFCIGRGTSDTNRANIFRVTYDGATIAKSAYETTGADYAEFREWSDGNPYNEDRRGYFVTLIDDKIQIASPGDFIEGIISGHPAVIGNFDECWNGRFLRDIWGDYVYTDVEVDEEVIDEDTGEIKTKKVTKRWYEQNPDYDPNIEYIPREKRPEWAAVGMLGHLSVRDDGSCFQNGYCTVAEGGIATASHKGYRVVKRIAENVVEIVFSVYAGF